MGLDKYGFKRKTYDELLTDMENKMRGLFGENVNLSPRSPFGLILRLFAWALSLVWELAEKVYYSAYVSKAEGVQLDNLAANKGLSREQASESTVELVFTGQPGFTIPEQTQFSTANNIYFFLIEDVTLDSNGNGQGRAVSVEKGIHTNVGPNTITIQAEPMEEITSVTNPEPATGGRDEETYEEFRERLKISPSKGGKATVPAIISNLRETDGVISANAVINNKNVPDQYGNPPKSVHVYVLGGLRDEIAEAIFDAVAGGIETVGQEMVLVEDISGEQHEVRFDYVDEVNIRIQISLQTNPTFPVDGEKRIKDELIKFIGGTDSNGIYWIGHNMGQDVIYSKLFRVIDSAADGIEDISLSIGRDGGALANENIEIGPHETAKTRVDLIEVTVT
ncbi:baseplate J/gp47 family protein [Bacillus methanolicus]|uniref:baseplate J/gp47 family protein n=1 Tax=Bacillus methanolicus TaxID=1471 RepID=UPI0023805278|nr:baseplate J/gp47 family protein [Bacillus methanolicus]